MRNKPSSSLSVTVSPHLVATGSQGTSFVRLSFSSSDICQNTRCHLSLSVDSDLQEELKSPILKHTVISQSIDIFSMVGLAITEELFIL